jgi:hypothetical protein
MEDGSLPVNVEVAAGITVPSTWK